MADHGARVIKVENPTAPEPTRSPEAFPWQQGGETVMFRNTQRGKESIALDLKSESSKRPCWRWRAKLTWWWRRSAPASPNVWASITSRYLQITRVWCIAQFQPLGRRALGKIVLPMIPPRSPPPGFSMSPAPRRRLRARDYRRADRRHAVLLPRPLRYFDGPLPTSSHR